MWSGDCIQSALFQVHDSLLYASVRGWVNIPVSNYHFNVCETPRIGLSHRPSVCILCPEGSQSCDVLAKQHTLGIQGAVQSVCTSTIHVTACKRTLVRP